MKQNLVWKNFQSSLGVLLAVTVVIAGIAGLAAGIAWGHDELISRSYDAAPRYDHEINWGAFSISIDSKNTERNDPIPEHDVSCYSPVGRLGSFFYPGKNTNDPNCKATMPAVPGSSETTAKLRLKNRLWLKSVKFSDSTILAKYGGKTTTVDVKGIDNGQFFVPGKGASANIKSSFGEALEGDFVLVNGSKKVTLK